MMFKSDKINSTFDENLRCTVIKIPYKGNAHMLVVIPEKEGDYISIEDHLTTELVESWLGNMKTRYCFDIHGAHLMSLMSTAAKQQSPSKFSWSS